MDALWIEADYSRIQIAIHCLESMDHASFAVSGELPSSGHKVKSAAITDLQKLKRSIELLRRSEVIKEMDRNDEFKRLQSLHTP